MSSGDDHVEVFFADGTTERHPGLHVDRRTSAKVFARSGEITLIHAYVPDHAVQAAMLSTTETTRR